MSQIQKLDSYFDAEGLPLRQSPTGNLGPQPMSSEFVARREQRFSAIFSQSSHFIGLLNLDGTVVEINPKLLSFAGVTVDVVVGRLFWQTIWWAEASQATLQQAIAQAAQGQLINYETEILGESDRTLTIDLTLQPIRDQTDTILWLLVEGRDITKRRQAEAEIQRLNAELEQRVSRRNTQLEAAKAQTQLYADIVHNMQMAIHVWHLADPDDDTSLELISLNPIAQQIANRPLASMLGKRILECFPSMPRNQVAIIAEIARNGQQKVDLETHYSDDQVSGFYTCHAFPLPGRCVGAAIEDITERKRAELALQESERLFATIANLSPVGIFRMDADGNNIYVNDRWLEITGLPASRAHGKAWQEALHPDDRDKMFTEWEEANRLRQPYTAECRFLHPNGSAVWVLGQITPEFADNLLIGYVGTITDISDRKQAEIELRESERRYATLAALSPVGIFHTDAYGNCLYANERWRNIAGLSEAEAMGDGWIRSIHPDDRHRIAAGWEQAIHSDQPFQVEYRFRSASGNITWVMGQATAEIDDSGKIIGYIGTITDITERKRSEMDLQDRANELSQVNLLLTRTTSLLEERNRELDQFAYVASHDLKAPLRAIANLSEWIEDDLADSLPPENQRQMQLLRGRVHRMEALINGLLQYSRVGRTEVDTQTVSVQTLLTEVVDSLDPPDEFTVTIGEGMPTLQTKSLLLRQVFANLISNAINHHPRSDGHVSVTVKEQALFYEFAVSDDGRGIAPEHHEKIFDIFHTLESRDTKESTGIGLSIVKKIVETEGGTIQVDSQLGAGTTFRFTWLKQPKVQ
ncbi:PAS domain S-box protein [Phormidium tenue FACHB-886]|nr:PAS domain S-box protein [Phormidium tenue FACHB-886]